MPNSWACAIRGIACEPFRQWVIEDNFVTGRPEWEKVGAQLVATSYHLK
ncbi:hypothetical protein ACLK1Y_24310 [Escherichia coli]